MRRHHAEGAVRNPHDEGERDSEIDEVRVHTPSGTRISHYPNLRSQIVS